jgi:hypothetical protein
MANDKDLPDRHLEMTYPEACHAVQSGIAFELAQVDPDSGTPKHLRTGLDLRACDHCTLVRLLIAKGLLTDEEYVETIRLETIREVIRLEDELSAKTGATVRLG